MADTENVESNKSEEESADHVELVKDGEGAEERVSKRPRLSQADQSFMSLLPSAKGYEVSYMHRDTVIAAITTKTHFIITASTDGHVKFWKKAPEGIEFVKHFRAHMLAIVGLCCTADGLYAATTSTDKALKVFDVNNFDMLTMLDLGYVPGVISFLYCAPRKQTLIGCSKGTEVLLYDYISGEVIHTVKVHMSAIVSMKFSPTHNLVLSADDQGIIEYWSSDTFTCPKTTSSGGTLFQYKTDTDLFTFLKDKCSVLNMTISADGRYFATTATDRKVRVFHVLSAKLYRVYDESLAVATQLQQREQLIPAIDFGRRIAGERDLEKTDQFRQSEVIFADKLGYCGQARHTQSR